MGIFSPFDLVLGSRPTPCGEQTHGYGDSTNLLASPPGRSGWGGPQQAPDHSNGKRLPERECEGTTPGTRPDPSVLPAAVMCSFWGVLRAQVCFIFPAPCWERGAFSSDVCTGSDSAPLSSHFVSAVAPGATKPQFHLRSPATLEVYTIPCTLRC